MGPGVWRVGDAGIRYDTVELGVAGVRGVGRVDVRRHPAVRPPRREQDLAAPLRAHGVDRASSRGAPGSSALHTRNFM